MTALIGPFPAFSVAEYRVGDRVRAKEAIYEPADDHAPGGYLCNKGDLLIVRKLTPQFKRSLSVSHESITDQSFGVEPSEIEPDGEPAAHHPEGEQR